MTSTRALLLLLAVLAVGCLDQGGAPPPTTDRAGPDTTTTTVRDETTTTLVSEGTGTAELPVGVREELDDLILVTQQLRGLAFLEPPDFDVVSSEELAQTVRERVQEDLEDVGVDQALYEALGLLEPGTDLETLYLDLLAEQVAGYYDLDTRELVVPMRAGGFAALERSTIVHELTHALTDQHFGIAELSSQLDDEQRYDEGAALLALIEGDAMVTQVMHLQTLPLDDQRAMLEESLALDTPALDAAPQFLADSLVFPYVEGPPFVQRLMELDGREGVDAAYADPPVSTEQILSPQDYGTDLPVEVVLPAVSAPGYEVEEESTWGELGFQLMLDQVLGDGVEAANGWGGDEYAVLWDGTEVALALAYVGDAPADTEELRQALTEYATAVLEVPGSESEVGGLAFRADDFMWVGSADERLFFVVAGNPEVGASLAEQMVTSG